MYDLPALLDHGKLVVTNRNGRGLEGGDVRCLADRIGKESYRNARLKFSHLNLALHGGVSLQSGDGNQVHVIKGELTQVRNLRLNEQSGLRRIQSAGHIVQCDLNNILPYLLRILDVVGQCLRIGDHDKCLFIFSGVLQLHTSSQRAHIMTYMESSCRSVSGQNNLAH